VPAMGCSAARRLLAVPCDHYFDDVDTVQLQHSARAAQRAVGELFALLGYPFSRAGASQEPRMEATRRPERAAAQTPASRLSAGEPYTAPTRTAERSGDGRARAALPGDAGGGFVWCCRVVCAQSVLSLWSPVRSSVIYLVLEIYTLHYSL
jgi:hypothetical protein